MSSTLRFRCTSCYSTGGAGDFSQAQLQQNASPCSPGGSRNRLCKICEGNNNGTKKQATAPPFSNSTSRNYVKTLHRRNLATTNMNPISHAGYTSTTAGPAQPRPSSSAQTTTITATGPLVAPAQQQQPKKKTGQVYPIDPTKLSPVPLSESSSRNRRGGSATASFSSSPCGSYQQPADDLQIPTEKKEEQQLLLLQEEMEQLHVIDSLGRIAGEYARTRGFPWVISNPYLKFFNKTLPFSSSPPGPLLGGSSLLEQLTSLNLFASGLRHLGYSSFTDLLDMPSHYTMGFHGTPSLDNVVSIFQGGFDPTRRSGQAYGPGEYFDLSGDGSVATGYARGDAKGCLIVAMIVEKTKSGKPIVEFTKHNDNETIGVLCNPKPSDVASGTTATSDGSASSISLSGTNSTTPLPPLSYCIPCAVVSANKDRLEELESLLKALVESASFSSPSSASHDRGLA